jgi:hypothetical protein
MTGPQRGHNSRGDGVWPGETDGNTAIRFRVKSYKVLARRGALVCYAARCLPRWLSISMVRNGVFAGETA